MANDGDAILRVQNDFRLATSDLWRDLQRVLGEESHIVDATHPQPAAQILHEEYARRNTWRGITGSGGSVEITGVAGTAPSGYTYDEMSTQRPSKSLYDVEPVRNRLAEIYGRADDKVISVEIVSFPWCKDIEARITYLISGKRRVDCTKEFIHDLMAGK